MRLVDLICGSQMSEYKIVNIGNTWADHECLLCGSIVCVDMEDYFKDVHDCGKYNAIQRAVVTSNKLLNKEIDEDTFRRVIDLLIIELEDYSLSETNQMQIDMWFPNDT